MAGGIAHDFNNILTAIIGNISIGKMMVGENIPEIKEFLEESEKGCMRAKELTRQLLTFSKGGEPVKSVINIKQLIVSTVNFTLHGSNVRCEMAIDEDLSPVEVDEGQIAQVIQNLVINADQAMPEGGLIRIRAFNREAWHRFQRPHRRGQVRLHNCRGSGHRDQRGTSRKNI